MALSGQYVDLSEVIERIYHDYPFTEDISVSESSLNAFRCLGLLGVPEFYIEKVTDGQEDNPDPIEIVNYRGNLPVDIHSIVLTRDYDTFLPMYCTNSPFKNNETIPFDPYESSLQYHTNNSFIFTSFETGNVEMVYKAFPVSPLGLPLIPAEERIIQAVVTFIAEKIGFKLWAEGRLPRDVYEHIEQQALFYAIMVYTL